MITFLNELALFISKALVTFSAIGFDFVTSLLHFKMPRYYRETRHAYRSRKPADAASQAAASTLRKRGRRHGRSSRLNEVVHRSIRWNYNLGEDGQHDGDGIPMKSTRVPKVIGGDHSHASESRNDDSTLEADEQKWAIGGASATVTNDNG